MERPSDEAETTPRLVRSLADDNVRAVSVHAGDAHSACVDEDGTLYVWGSNRYNQLGLGGKENHPRGGDAFVTTPTTVPRLPRVGSFACGGSFSVAANRHGAGLKSWGANGSGELGEGHDAGNESRAAPRAVDTSSVKGSADFVRVSAGWRHAAAIATDGGVYTWGWGGSAGQHHDDAFSTGGQLCLGVDNDFWEPFPVPDFTRRGDGGRRLLAAKDVSCGFNHTVVLVDDGAV